MKKIFLFVFSLFSVSVFSEDKIAEYTMSYFSKGDFPIEASAPEKDNTFYYYIGVAGESLNDKVFISVPSNDIDVFINTLAVVKEKFEEWKAVSTENGVTDFKKEFPISFPKVTIAWYGSKWWFSYNKIFTPDFLVLKDGRSLVVVRGNVTASTNQYITKQFYIVFQDGAEIDKLIEGLNVDCVLTHYQQKENSDNLFK